MDMWTFVRRCIILYFGIIVKEITCGPICPEWCECVSLTEGQHYLRCEWPHIPDAQVFLSFPTNTVTRLTVRCKDDARPSSKYSSRMFEKFSKLRHLSIENCHSEFKKLPKSFAYGLNELKSLHLDDLSLETIEKGALSDLERLEKLTISSNFNELPRDELCNLKDLKYLNLSGNQLTNFADVGLTNCDDVDSMSQVIILDLDNNRISKINDDSLNNFHGLRILKMSNNSLREIPFGFFKNTLQLKELYLNGNQISSVNDLPSNLSVLDLSHNDLHLIPPVLSNHNNLYKLNLSHNFIDSNSPFVIHHTNHLTELDFSFNRLRTVNANFFSNLISLISLNLENNEIRHLEMRAYQNLTRLKRLSLANNKLSIIKRFHFDGLSELTHLNLHNNTLSSLDGDVFAPILNLNSLILSKNLLLDVPAALYVLSNLENLDLSRNKISKVRKFVLDNLTNLRNLNLANNQITSLERNLFARMINLKRLDLSYNSIELLQSNFFDGAEMLEEISLQQNFIKNVANVFQTLKSLQILNVSENRIEKVDFNALPPRLTTFLANSNQISHVTHSAIESRHEFSWNLRILDFSYNKLTELNAKMIPVSVEHANFSNNVIHALNDDTLRNKTNLLSLDLRNNILTNITPTSLTKDGEPRLSVYLSENPLICTCKIHWLKSFTVASTPTQNLLIADREKLSCSTLIHPLQIRPVSSVSDREFLCSYKELCIDTCLCCEYDVCDCKNVCPDNCQCYFDAQNALNIVKCPNQTQESMDHFKLLPMYATAIYFDGGNISRLYRSAFFGRYRLKQLFLNGSYIETIDSKAFSGLTSLEIIDLSDNYLEQFIGDEFFNTPKVEALFLNGNRLTFINADAFDNLPNLKMLTLHDNKLQTLPEAIMHFKGVFQGLTLANNPWKCDCDDRYKLQIWLPRHRTIVSDSQTIYCYENLTQFDNVTILSLLPPSYGSEVVKVNFWTFVNEINRTFCYPSLKSLDQNLMTRDLTPGDNNALTVVPDIPNNVLIFISVSASAVILVVIIFVAVWKCRLYLRQKSFYNKYSAAPSVNSSNTAPTSGSTCNSPVPLLQYKAFVSYSKSDEVFVVTELLPLLEQSCQYSQICLLHRDFNSVHLNSDLNQHLADDIFRAMERSSRVITVVSSSFIKNDWTHLHIRPAYHNLLRYKHCKVIMIVLDELPTKMDSMLAHYVRTNRCLYYKDPLFWQKLSDSIPDDNVGVNGSLITDSTNYADMYGTIVPSRFV